MNEVVPIKRAMAAMITQQEKAVENIKTKDWRMITDSFEAKDIFIDFLHYR